MAKKPKKIQLVGSDTLDEGIVAPPESSLPATNDIGERIGSLETEISILKAKKFIEINLETGLVTALIVVIVGFFLWTLNDKHSAIKNSLDELNCKNIKLQNCYGKCNFREFAKEYNNCELPTK